MVRKHRNNRKVNLSWLSIRMSSSAFDWRHYFNEQIALAPSAEICGKVNSLPMQRRYISNKGVSPVNSTLLHG